MQKPLTWPDLENCKRGNEQAYLDKNLRKRLWEEHLVTGKSRNQIIVEALKLYLRYEGGK